MRTRVVVDGGKIEGRISSAFVGEGRIIRSPKAQTFRYNDRVIKGTHVYTCILYYYYDGTRERERSVSIIEIRNSPVQPYYKIYNTIIIISGKSCIRLCILHSK